MDGRDQNQHSDAASASSGGSNSSNNSVASGPEDNTTVPAFQPPVLDSAAKARVNNGGTASGITNSGRWSNEEHERFLQGLEQFG